jgi:hypothetical protein
MLLCCKDLTSAYADAVIDHGWLDMAQGRLPEDSPEINESLWKALMGQTISRLGPHYAFRRAQMTMHEVN